MTEEAGLPLRRCRKCGSDAARPTAHLDEGLTHYTQYDCPDCGATFKISPPGATALSGDHDRPRRARYRRLDVLV